LEKLKRPANQSRGKKMTLKNLFGRGGDITLSGRKGGGGSTFYSHGKWKGVYLVGEEKGSSLALKRCSSPTLAKRQEP